MINKLYKIMLIVLLMLLLPLSVSFAESRQATVTEFHGDVQVKRAVSEKFIKVFNKMKLEEGDTVKTGKDSKVVFTLENDKSVTLAANTEIMISELDGDAKSSKTTFTLKNGGIGSKIDSKLDANSSYKIKTPTAVMGVRGTEFYVQMRQNKVDVWLSEGVIKMDYRLDRQVLQNLGGHKGVPNSTLLYAPKRFSFSLDGEKFVPTEQEFKLDGLYKEFLDPNSFSDLGFSVAQVEIAVNKANEVTSTLDSQTEGIPNQVPTYTPLEGHDDDDDDDDDDDSEIFVASVRVTSFLPSTPQVDIYPINEMVEYTLDNDHSGRQVMVLDFHHGGNHFYVRYYLLGVMPSSLVDVDGDIIP